MFATLDPSLLLATATTIDIRRCNICKAQISLHSPWKRCDGCRSKKAAEHRKWRDGKKDRLSLLPVCSTVPLKRKSGELKINGPSKRPKAQSNGKAMQQQDCPEYCQVWRLEFHYHIVSLTLGSFILFGCQCLSHRCTKNSVTSPRNRISACMPAILLSRLRTLIIFSVPVW